jgi:hypothetical protein
MHGARIHVTCRNTRPILSAADWHACACIIDRSFVIIRLKHLAV